MDKITLQALIVICEGHMALCAKPVRLAKELADLRRQLAAIEAAELKDAA